jgi:hypothetical protein
MITDSFPPTPAWQPPPPDLVLTLPGGTTVRVRPIQPADAAALQRFHSRLSETTVYHRFISCVPRLDAERAS